MLEETRNWNVKAKRGKDTEVAELVLELSNVRNSEDIEDWFSLSGVTPIGEWGTIRLRTRYLHDLIMPQVSIYQSIEEEVERYL